MLEGVLFHGRPLGGRGKGLIRRSGAPVLHVKLAGPRLAHWFLAKVVGSGFYDFVANLS